MTKTLIDVKELKLPPILPAPLGLEELVELSLQEPYAIVEQLVHDYSSGKNRFKNNGEVLLGAFVDGRLAGVCGLNRDPYVGDERTGRLRHLFIHPNLRRKGIALLLIRQTLHNATEAFDVIRLRTDNPKAIMLYEGYGFVKTDQDKASHILIDLGHNE